jgi:hypothetical protein
MAARPLLSGIPLTQKQIIEQAIQRGGIGLLPDAQRASRTSEMLSHLLETGGQNLKSPWALGGNLLATALLSRSADKRTRDLYERTGTVMSDAATSNETAAFGDRKAAPTAMLQGVQQQAPIQAAAPQAPTEQTGFGAPPQIKMPPLQLGQMADAIQPEAAMAPPPVGGLSMDDLSPERMAMAESRNRRGAVSSKGAESEMQVMGATANDPGFGVRPAQDNSLAEKARVGRDYLAAMKGRYSNDPTRVVAAYNWGPGRADKWSGDLKHLPKETLALVDRIISGRPPTQTTAPSAQAPPVAQDAAVAPAPGPALGMGQGVLAGFPELQAAAAGRGGGAAPTAQGGVPTGPGATPGDIAEYDRLMGLWGKTQNPAYYDAAQKVAQDVIDRKRAPVELDKGWTYGPDGKPIYIQKGEASSTPYEDVYTAPSGEVTRRLNPRVQDGGKSYLTERGLVPIRPAPEGGASQSAASAELTPSAGKPISLGNGLYRFPGADHIWRQEGLGWKKEIDDAFPVAKQQERISGLQNSQEAEKARLAVGRYMEMVKATGQPGGVPDAILKDLAAQVATGGVARQFSTKMFDEAAGPIKQFLQFKDWLLSGQKLPPEVRQALAHAVFDAATQTQRDLRARINVERRVFGDAGKAQGQDLVPVIDEIASQYLPELPAVPNINTIAKGAPGGFRDLIGGGRAVPATPGIDPRLLEEKARRERARAGGR